MSDKRGRTKCKRLNNKTGMLTGTKADTMGKNEISTIFILQ
jgi:hypothetical protein